MMKKLIATALAAAMIFGLVSVALAAGFSDIEDHARKNDILKLVSLGIIDGYPDGTFKPENPVTRAEFAKLIVTTMGLGDAAKLMAGVATPFADVPANHWASGYINLAHSEDIIDGYPDGTFKPAGNVTYAEALKMVLCALGYTEDLIKPIYWPVTWIAKAVNVGLTKGVDVSPNLPAPRGQIAALLENSLTIDKVVQTGYGDKVEYVVKAGETFLKGLAGAEPVVGHLFDSPDLFANDGKSIKVEVTGNPTFKLLSAEDVKGLLGHRVKVWANASNEVLFVEDLTPADSVKSAVYSAANAVKIDGKVKTIDWASTRLFRNYAEVTADKKVASGEEISVIYHGDTPYAVLAFKYNMGIVDTVSTLYRTIRFRTGSLTFNKDAEVRFYGDAEALAEVKKDDVVQYFASDNGLDVVVVVTRDAYSGQFTKLVDSKATIGGSVFSAVNSSIFKDGDLGSDVKVLLNKDGKVVACDVVEDAVTSNIAMVTGKAGPIPTIDGPQYWVKLLLSDGTKTNYQTTKTIHDAVYAGYVIDYTLDDGEIDKATTLMDATVSPYDLNLVKDYRLVNNYVVTSGTVIFSYKDSKAAVATYEDLLANKDGLKGFVNSEGNKAVVVVMKTGQAEAADPVYGVVTGTYKAYSDGKTRVYVSVLVDGVVSDYEIATGSDTDIAGKVVTLEVAGSAAVVKVATNLHNIPETGKEWRVSSIDGVFITIAAYDSLGVASTERLYVVDGDTQYVDYTGSTPKALGMLSVGDEVEVYSSAIGTTSTQLAKVIVVK